VAGDSALPLSVAFVVARTVLFALSLALVSPCNAFWPGDSWYLFVRNLEGAMAGSGAGGLLGIYL